MAAQESIIAMSGLAAVGTTVNAATLVVRLHHLPAHVDAAAEGVSSYALGKWARLHRAQVCSPTTLVTQEEPITGWFESV